MRWKFSNGARGALRHRDALAWIDSCSAIGRMSLIEVCLAMFVLSIAALSSAQLFAASLVGAIDARLKTEETMLAAQKVEQLRGLAWRFDGPGTLMPVSDLATDLSREPATWGGSGLGPSPGNSLAANTAGFFDFLDKHGHWAGSGAATPRTAVFVRRWNVSTLPGSTADAVILQVLVRRVSREAGPGGVPPPRRAAGDTIVVTALTRKTW